MSQSPQDRSPAECFRDAGVQVPEDLRAGSEANLEHLKIDCEIVRRGFPPEVEPAFGFDPDKICGR